MTSTPATLALDRAGVAYTVHPYQHSDGASSYGEEAAAALGVAPERVLKTLVVDTGAGVLAVGIVPVSGQLDLKALAGALASKRVTMADQVTAERSTGYVVGGISPFGQRKPLTTVLDESSLEFDTIYVSAGRRGVELEVSPTDLVRALGGHIARIGR